MSEATGDQRRQTIWALLALLLVLAVWLWPIGIGGKMPVGGDVTQFSMGLMVVFHRALRSGRLPLWNDLWGYGFPGVAESQMGVFYPPHMILYRLLPTEAAYTVSLVVHTVWGALGAFWAARRFGVAPIGAALAGFAWSASGFFLIHLPHQWGYTTGCWMPWAWGLAWPLVRGEGTRRAPFFLAGVLALQVLPGHFQLAFITQVSLVLMGLWGLIESAVSCARSWIGPSEPSAEGSGVAGAKSSCPGADHRGTRTLPRSPIRGVILVALALAAVLPLAAAQLWPTFRLVRLTATRRDFEYLSGFAATPLHLVSFVAPGLFHRSPLWRPLAWDPFHASPEEYLAYIGLVPLFLALGSVAHGFRRDAGVRALALLALGTLILSLGPYVPGFELWSRLPGFSFFRAPARWNLSTSLALALLAGRGFDTICRWYRPGRSLARFALLAALASLVVVLLIELALASTERSGWPVVTQGFERAWRARPWRGAPSFRDLAVVARQPQHDLQVDQGLAREGVRITSAGGPRFSPERSRIYRQELGETAVLLLALLAVAPFLGRPRWAGAALWTLTALDLWALGRHRAIDLAPIRPLEAQSPVLARLAEYPRGTRTADVFRNLPMVAGVAPISAYRTLDLPALVSLTHLAQEPPGRPDGDRLNLGALHATGTGVRVFDPFESRLIARGDRDPPGWGELKTIRDPTLAGWLYGVPWVASQGPWASTFVIGDLGAPPARAWLVPLTSARAASILDSWSGNPTEVLELFGSALPLEIRARSPERLDVVLRAEGPGAVILSQLADPQWRAVWSGPGGERPAEIQTAFRRPRQSGWQAVRVPGPGIWTLRLEYSGRDVYEGLATSALAGLAGVVAYLKFGRNRAVTSSKGGRT